MNYSLNNNGPWIDRLFIVLGMVVYMVGDFIMGGVIEVPMRMVFGMGAFALGHLLYLIVFLRHVKGKPANQKGLIFTLVGLGILVLWIFLVWNPEEFILSLAALGYSFFLGILIALGLIYRKVGKFSLTLAAGYFVYMVSDLIIALHSIKGISIPNPPYSDLVWSTYVAALVLVSIGFQGVLQRLGEPR